MNLQGKMVLGCSFSRDVRGSHAWGWEGRCSVQPEPVCIPGEGHGRGEGSQPRPHGSAQPQSTPKPGASGARVEAGSKAARGKGSLIRYALGQPAKLPGIWRCALLRGRPGGGTHKWVRPGGREATCERSPLPMKGLPRRRGEQDSSSSGSGDAFPRRGGQLIAAALPGSSRFQH